MKPEYMAALHSAHFDVFQAMDKAEAEHGKECSMYLPLPTDPRRYRSLITLGLLARHQMECDRNLDALAVLCEELGEAAEAMLAGDHEQAHVELVHCAAVCTMLAAGIKARRP